MYSLNNLTNWLMNLHTLNEQRARDDRRLKYRAEREGFARSATPAPAPVYDGVAPEEAPVCETGVVYESQDGDGASHAVIIDAGALKRTWIMISIYARVIATALPVNAVDASLYVSDDSSTWVRVGAYDISKDIHTATTMKLVRIPFRYFYVYFFTTDALHKYCVTGIWEEDR